MLRNNNQSELAIQRSAFTRLLQKPKLTVTCNVPILGRCADMVCMQGRFIFSIEFKLRDWRRAIKQAVDHKLASDYAYICIPERQILNNLLPELTLTGVGLLFFNEKGDWPFELKVKAPKSKDTWKIARENLLNYLIDQNGSWL